MFLFLVLGYVNNFNVLVCYICLIGGYLFGVFSVYDNYIKDRRYNFRCCILRLGENINFMLFFL